MKIIDIPFVKFLNITQSDCLQLFFQKELTNHVGSLHAGVLYTLAETQSGLFLQEQFNHLPNVQALLRAGEIKYKKEAKSEVKAQAFASKEELEKFETTLQKRGKALIKVTIELQSKNEIIASGTFTWFVRLL